LVKDKETKEPADQAMVGQILSDLLNRGVIAVPCGRYGTVVRFMPSLIIPRAYLEKAVDILLSVIKDVESTAIR